MTLACWCRGKTDYAVKSHSGDDKSSLDIACHGFSIPMRMSCKGLHTIHYSGESEVCSCKANATASVYMIEESCPLPVTAFRAVGRTLVVSLSGGVQEGTLESMAVTKGRAHLRLHSKQMHGWTVTSEFSAKGFSTSHVRHAASGAEPPEEVVMDAAKGTVIREELQQI